MKCYPVCLPRVVLQGRGFSSTGAAERVLRVVELLVAMVRI